MLDSEGKVLHSTGGTGVLERTKKEKFSIRFTYVYSRRILRAPAAQPPAGEPPSSPELYDMREQDGRKFLGRRGEETSHDRLKSLSHGIRRTREAKRLAHALLSARITRGRARLLR